MGENETETRVKELNEEEKVRELARMLGGVEVTDKTLEHAKEMLLQANLRKKEDIVSRA
jgi:DNA repair protein RecN (Recombination protein N)